MIVSPESSLLGVGADGYIAQVWTGTSRTPNVYNGVKKQRTHALNEMQQPASAVRWESAGTQGIGVLISDTLMFQRVAPEPSDENLGQFYGLALPLLMRGMPVEPVQIESAYSKSAAGFLDPYNSFSSPTMAKSHPRRSSIPCSPRG
jgi:hypothetical protein